MQAERDIMTKVHLRLPTAWLIWTPAVCSISGPACPCSECMPGIVVAGVVVSGLVVRDTYEPWS